MRWKRLHLDGIDLYLGLWEWCIIEENMDSVVALMKEKAPEAVVGDLLQRLEFLKNDIGEKKAEECKSHIGKKNNVKWLDILIVAYHINGGVLLRDSSSASQEENVEEETEVILPLENGCAQEEECVASGASTNIPTSPNFENTNKTRRESNMTKHFTDQDILDIEKMVASIDMISS